MLDIDLYFHKGILFIRLKGVLDKDTKDKLYDDVMFIKNSGINNIVFNLSEIKKIDSEGINSLLIIYYLCKVNNGNSLICGINDFLLKEINDSKLLSYITEASDELSAARVVNL